MPDRLRAAPLVAVAAATLAAAFAGAEDFLIPLGSSWRYHAEVVEPGRRWNAGGFDDSSWPQGMAGFGYGDSDDETVLAMRGRFTDVYIRRAFEVPKVPEELFLYVRYDDAFEAYLNGRLVARIGFDEDGVIGHEAEDVEVFRLPTRHLRKGRNVLAIRGVNVAADSSDFSLDAGLAAAPVPTQVVLRASAERDLARLRHRLVTQSSYLELNDRDPIGALDALATRLPDAMMRLDFLRAVQQLVSLIGDGHAGAAAFYDGDGAQYLPFSLADTAWGIVALDVQKPAFVDASHPYVAVIEGVAIEQWIRTAGRFVSNASPQLNRRRALRSVHRLDLLRPEFGRPSSDTTSITFTGADGARKTRLFAVSERRPRTARVPRGGSGILSGNVGYLVIPEMDDVLVPEILDGMDYFRDTHSLVIDVRGNGGGRYGVLRALAPYFLPPDAPARVTNVAAYRLAPHFEADHLASRPTFRLDHVGWTPGERRVVEQASAAFRPKWTPPRDKFSDWHFMLLNRPSDRTARTYYYDRPVAVLSDAECFSATDGFLAAFADLPRVRLVGQPSGGGSGRTQRFLLPETGVRVSLSSMASFRTNGALFDGFGIEVDDYVAPYPEDFLGDSDRVLERALAILKEQATATSP